MSRTLGFIAGLTVPAGIYYLSTVHLHGTTQHIADALHQQSLRLQDPTRLEPIVLDPRSHDSLAARIRQGWNDGIENGVRYIQEVDWRQAAKETGSAVSNVSRAAWDKAQPTLEDGRGKLHEISDSTRDAALHAGQAVGTTLHDAGLKGRELAHDASVKSQQMAHDAERKAHELAHEANMQAHRLAQAADKERHRLAQVGREDAVEAKEILTHAERELEAKYAKVRSEADVKTRAFRKEAVRQVHEAESILSRAGAKISDQYQAMKGSAADVLDRTHESAKNAAKQTADAARQAERKAEQSLGSAQLRASEEWIQAQDRYDALLNAMEKKADKAPYELQELLAGRRIGFTSVNDPSAAAKHQRAAEKYHEAHPSSFVKPGGPISTSTSAAKVASVVENTS